MFDYTSHVERVDIITAHTIWIRHRLVFHPMNAILSASEFLGLDTGNSLIFAQAKAALLVLFIIIASIMKEAY